MAYGQRKVPLKELKKLLDSGLNQKQAAEQLGFSERSVCLAVKKLNKLSPMFELSEKEQTFVQAMAKAPSQTEAAMQAFDCGSRDSAKVIGSQLMARPDIRDAFAAWMEFKGCGRERRAEKLAQFIEDPDPSVSLRALEIGMKAGDDFPCQRHVIENRDTVVYVVSFGAEQNGGQAQIIDIPQPKRLPAPEERKSNDEIATN